MSLPLRTPAPAPEPRRRSQRTRQRESQAHLRLVPPPVQTPLPATRGRGVFVLFICAILLAGLLGMLMFNTFLAAGAFRVTELKLQQAALARQEQSLMRQVAQKSAPGVLAQRAAYLGLVPVRTPAFLSLPDGTVIGKALPAQAPATADAADGTDVPSAVPALPSAASAPASQATGIRP